MLLGTTSAIITILLLWVMGLDYNFYLPFLLVSLWVLLPIFTRRSFLLVFRSFSSMVAWQIVVILVSLWEKVSSGSSYSTILDSSVLRIFLTGRAKNEESRLEASACKGPILLVSFHTGGSKST